MFERFTAQAREVVIGAQDEARRLGHGWIGCEHLLLAVAASVTPAGAVLRAGGAVPQAVEETMVSVLGPTGGDHDDAAALASVGIDLGQVRDSIESTFGPGALDGVVPAGRRSRRLRRRRHRRSSCRPAGRRLCFTPRAKRCLESALREALRRRDRHVGVEHVALALLAHDDTVAWRVLTNLGVELPALQREIDQAYRRPV